MNYKDNRHSSMKTTHGDNYRGNKYKDNNYKDNNYRGNKYKDNNYRGNKYNKGNASKAPKAKQLPIEELSKLCSRRAKERYREGSTELGKLNNILRNQELVINFLGKKFSMSDRNYYHEPVSDVLYDSFFVMSERNKKIRDEVNRRCEAHKIPEKYYKDIYTGIMEVYFKDQNFAYRKYEHITFIIAVKEYFLLIPPLAGYANKILDVASKIAVKINYTSYKRVSWYYDLEKTYLIDNDIELQYWIDDSILYNSGITDYTSYLSKKLFVKCLLDREIPISKKVVLQFRYRKVIAPNSGFVIKPLVDMYIDSILVREVLHNGIDHYLMLGIKLKGRYEGYISYSTLNLKTLECYSTDNYFVLKSLKYLTGVYEVDDDKLTEPKALSSEYLVMTPVWSHRKRYKVNQSTEINELNERYVTEVRMISTHIRNMGEGRTPSQDKLERAKLYNIVLKENQTIVEPRGWKENKDTKIIVQQSLFS